AVPYQGQTMKIELIIEDMEEPRFNVTSMDFSSNVFRAYYSDQRMKLETLQGHVDFIELTDNRIHLDYDIDVKEFSTFPGDRMYGTIDINI
ncbi:MAG: hypothetical protein R3240_08300, partial [Gammaproteobacteria bacterium]|nr:hypothetical protein [Gammaproteobacteria bacterium]